MRWSIERLPRGGLICDLANPVTRWRSTGPATRLPACVGGDVVGSAGLAVVVGDDAAHELASALPQAEAFLT
jgi:hypothetical protein